MTGPGARSGTGTPHYDVVVVGSGFGGSVTSCRLAEAGLSVCVLERGRSYPPGSFPRSPYRMKRNFWDPSEGYYGLYHVWTSSLLGGVTASGIGGGSLIFANVLLRKDEHSFVSDGEDWPVTRADLDPHYERAERALAAQPFPIDHPPYRDTHRAQALRAAARAVGLPWSTPPLAVTFANPGDEPAPGYPIRETFPNLHHRPRETCRLCAECCFGCNFGSKNSLDMNYLTRAQRAGAELNPLSEVRVLRPRAGGKPGYLVRYVRHDLVREGRPTATHDQAVLPLRDVTADRVVLAAGTFGTTYLLLRNRAALPGLSEALGTRFCTNGDFLAFGYRCSEPAGAGRRQRIIEADVGTAITGAIRALPGPGIGGYLEDMGYPDFLTWLLQIADLPNTVGAVRRLAARLIASWCAGGDGPGEQDALDGDLAALFGSSEFSASLLPLIGVGQDVPDGHMSLRDGLLDVSWRADASRRYFDSARQTARSVVTALGGHYLDTLSGPLRYGVTMHPLGGCPMAHDASRGVVDSWGEVFGNPGLFIADGSVLPGPVGANPSLTIAALADRTADRMLGGG